MYAESVPCKFQGLGPCVFVHFPWLQHVILSGLWLGCLTQTLCEVLPNFRDLIGPWIGRGSVGFVRLRA